MPTVLSGARSLERVGADAPIAGHRVIVVADEAVVASGYAARLGDQLADQGAEEWTVEIVAPGEPTSSSVDDVADSIRGLRREGSVVVVGVGGGSALDTAKQAAVIASAPRGIEHYALARRPLPARETPLIAVPTTAGTGAEVTRTCVVSDRRGDKVWTWGDALLPDVVVLDPAATATMPAHVTAATGLDAFVHATEAMSGRRASVVVVASGRHAARIVLDSLPAAVADGTDLAVRLAMQEAALLAGLAIDGGGTGIAHSIGHALGSLAHVPHGVAVAVGLGAALAWNVAGVPEAYGDLAAVVGCPAARLPDVYDELMMSCRLADAVARIGPLALDTPTLAASMIAVANLPMYENNCRRPDDAERLDLAAATLRLWDELLAAARAA